MKADIAARAAHSLPHLSDFPLCLSEARVEVRKQIKYDANLRWRTWSLATQYGQVRQTLFDFSCHPSHHRKLEVSLTRLRSGHVGLQEYLHRIGKVDSPLCSHCDLEAEDVEHYLIHCSAYI